jgi:hypothetical protein
VSIVSTRPAGGGQPQEEHEESDGESTTTSLTWQDKTTLTFTAEAGDYLLLYSAEYYNGNVRVENTTDVATYGQVAELSPSLYTSFGGFAIITLTAGSKTIIIQWESNGGTAYIRRARLYVKKL